MDEFSLEELLREAARRMTYTNGIAFVDDALLADVTSSLMQEVACRGSHEPYTHIDMPEETLW